MIESAQHSIRPKNPCTDVDDGPNGLAASWRLVKHGRRSGADFKSVNLDDDVLAHLEELLDAPA